ncbi:hypothetical protein SXCC_03647 [Gluconacetobacter sp. SXCC-1]|nr:hypothetical protein SXCC_03647 [Gluconacetobacter sp. SXCC-1]
MVRKYHTIFIACISVLVFFPVHQLDTRGKNKCSSQTSAP